MFGEVIVMSSYPQKTKQKDDSKYEWGNVMDDMLKKGSPRFMNSPLAHVELQKPRDYEKKDGNKRKIFIIEEE
jgi:hypothetical protein